MVIVKRVVRVMLTRTTETTRIDHTSYPGTELWRVEWTERHASKADHMTMSHSTEAAARPHVSGLREQRIDGLAVSGIYVEYL